MCLSVYHDLRDPDSPSSGSRTTHLERISEFLIHSLHHRVARETREHYIALKHELLGGVGDADLVRAELLLELHAFGGGAVVDKERARAGVGRTVRGEVARHEVAHGPESIETDVVHSVPRGRGAREGDGVLCDGGHGVEVK